MKIDKKAIICDVLQQNILNQKNNNYMWEFIFENFTWFGVGAAITTFTALISLLSRYKASKPKHKRWLVNFATILLIISIISGVLEYIIYVKKTSGGKYKLIAEQATKETASVKKELELTKELFDSYSRSVVKDSIIQENNFKSELDSLDKIPKRRQAEIDSLIQNHNDKIERINNEKELIKINYESATSSLRERVTLLEENLEIATEEIERLKQNKVDYVLSTDKIIANLRKDNADLEKRVAELEEESKNSIPENAYASWNEAIEYYDKAQKYFRDSNKRKARINACKALYRFQDVESKKLVEGSEVTRGRIERMENIINAIDGDKDINRIDCDGIEF
jgi:hypothetical protein